MTISSTIWTTTNTKVLASDGGDDTVSIKIGDRETDPSGATYLYISRSQAEALRAQLNRIFAPALVSEPSTPSTKAA